MSLEGTGRPVSNLGFVHRHEPPADPGAPTLLLLHGTGGDENDLLPLGRALVPGAGLLSPRGKVSEGGALRFFRRLAEGVFDLDDLAARTDELAAFVDDATVAYGIDRERLVVVGFSNGANIAVSMLLKHPLALRRAILLSPMLPFEPPTKPDLARTDVFIGAGRSDPIAPASQVEELVRILTDAGAGVTTYWHDDGHGITQEEFNAAQRWIGA